eukprot:COSAG02_NODE_2032_length_10063_cov_11.627057_6_plen_160_part_00
MPAEPQKTTSLTQEDSLRYTWNPGPVGATGVDVTRWSEDGTLLEKDATVPVKLTKPAPSWAWPGGDGQHKVGVEQWVTEMNSVVDEMFEAVEAHVGAPDHSAGDAKYPRSKNTSSSVNSDGGSGGLYSASETLEDASLLGRSRVAAGVIGLRRYAMILP